MHLVEQPTLFYAVAISLVLLHSGGGHNLELAWAYVILRILHSLVQISFNRIIVRFTLFALSSLTLIAMIIQAFRALMERGILG